MTARCMHNAGIWSITADHASTGDVMSCPCISLCSLEHACLLCFSGIWTSYAETYGTPQLVGDCNLQFASLPLQLSSVFITGCYTTQQQVHQHASCHLSVCGTMSAAAYCLCPRGSNNVRGIARGPSADEVLVTVQNDGVVCYSSARQVKPQTLFSLCISVPKSACTWHCCLILSTACRVV